MDGGNMDNTFVLMDGTALEGIPTADAKRSWPSKDELWAEEELFRDNAHFLLANAKRIFADSRMFLAPVRVMSGLAYLGAFPMPLLGGYLEWWINCPIASEGDGEEKQLVYIISGSPLSGSSASMAVKADGSCCRAEPRLHDLAHTFLEAMGRYKEPCNRFMAYSLEEVLDILKGEKAGRFEHSVQRIALEHRINRQAATIEDLGKKIERQSKMLGTYRLAMLRAIVRENLGRVVEAIRQCEELAANAASGRNKGSTRLPLTTLFRELGKRDKIDLGTPSMKFLKEELAKNGCLLPIQTGTDPDYRSSL